MTDNSEEFNRFYKRAINGKKGNLFTRVEKLEEERRRAGAVDITNIVTSVVGGVGLDGDVTGPASAVDGDLAVFDGVTGKLIKDGGAIPAGGLGDVIGDSVPSVAGNIPVYADTTGKHIEDSGSSPEDLASSPTVYFLNDNDSTVLTPPGIPPAYKKAELTFTDTTSSETITINNASGTVLLQKWTTAQIGVPVIARGLWSFEFWVSTSAPTTNVDIYYTLAVLYNGGGGQQNILSSGYIGHSLSATPTKEIDDIIKQELLTNVDDTIVLQLFASNSSATPIDVTVHYSDALMPSNFNAPIIVSITSGGTGDVIGDSVPSVDDNVVTYNSTTGKHIQDSGVGIAAVSGAISNSHAALTVTDTTSIDLTIAAGQVLSADHKTGDGLNHVPTTGASTQILQYSSAGTAKWVTVSGDAAIADGGALAVNKTRLNVRNETGVSIATTKAVYISGFNNLPLITLATNVTEVSHNVIGITVGAIAHEANGYVATSGQFDAETNGWVVGTELYLTAAGALTATAPTSGSVIHVAIVTVQANYPTGKLLFYHYPEENYLAGGAGVDTIIRMGDAIGANKTSFRDYANAEVAAVNSDGAFTAVSFNGLTSAQVTDLTDGNATTLHIHAAAAPAAHAATHVTSGGDTIADAIAAGNSGLMSGAMLTKLNGIEVGADVTDATNVDAAGAVMNADYDANTILAANSDNTPAALTIGANTFPARSSAGNIAAKTLTDFALTILDDADGAAVRATIGAGTGAGTVTGVTGTAPISSTGGAAPAISLDNSGVTYAKIQDVSATSRVLGRISALAGVVEELTGANVRTIANVADGAQVNVLEGVTGTAPIVAGAVAAKSQAISISASSAGAAGSMSAAHYTKLEGIEAGADVTDATNVAAAGAIMASVLTERGSIIFRNATVPAELLHGNSGQVLTSGGNGADPSWQTPTVGTVTSVTGTAPIASSGGATPAISLDDGGVTYAKMQDVSATSRVLGRISALAGDVEELTGANVRTIANVADGATANAKATGAELDTGTDDVKFATAKALVDSHDVPSVTPGTSGNLLTSNGTDWTSAAPAAVAAHNLFSATHGDMSGAASPVDGDIIIGNVTPKWSKLAISVPAANLINVLGIVNGELRPSWKALLDATNPAAIGTAAAGTATTAAHRDHVHTLSLTGDVTTTSGVATTIGAKKVTVAMLADGTDGQLITWDAAGVAAVVATGTATHVLTSNGAGTAPTFQAAASPTHALLSATHSDSTAGTVTRGDIIVGIGLTPKWTEYALSVPAGAGLINVFGVVNGETEPTWKALMDATNPAAIGTAAPGTATTAAHRDHVHAATLAGAGFANQGTTTTVLHGNAAGNPAWGAVVEADQTLADNTTNNASTTKHGYALKAVAPAANLMNVMGIVNGETIWSNKAIFDATNPAALGVAAPGTATTASHRDHVHALQTSVTGNAGTVTVADAGSDATTWLLLGTAQTGSLAPATDGGLTYDAGSNALTTGSYNNVAITVPGTLATLTIAAGKTLTASNTVTITATDGVTIAAGGGIVSGTYTPTLTNVTNAAASAVLQDFTYTRVGNIVTGAGALSIDPTATGTVRVDFTIPIASAFTTSYDLNGTGSSGASTNTSAALTSNATDDRASIFFTAADTANINWRIVYQYIIK